MEIITETKTTYETDLDHRGRPTGAWVKDYSVKYSFMNNQYPDEYPSAHYRNIEKFTRTITYGEWIPFEVESKVCACPSEMYVTIGTICPFCGGSRPW